ncbi:MAG: hypothetical protein ACR2NP_12645, partial [Pirellulaceae bacterium]
MKVICVGGWACDDWLWERHTGRLRALLPDTEVEVTCLPAWGNFVFKEAMHFDLAVGHSLGLMWLLDHDQVSFERLVSIAGFTRFVSGEDFPGSPDRAAATQDEDEFHSHIARPESRPVGWPDRALSRMQSGLAVDPGPVLADFFENAGAADDVQHVEADVEILGRG